jgi:hypothetical protein
MQDQLRFGEELVANENIVLRTTFKQFFKKDTAAVGGLTCPA